MKAKLPEKFAGLRDELSRPMGKWQKVGAQKGGFENALFNLKTWEHQVRDSGHEYDKMHAAPSVM